MNTRGYDRLPIEQFGKLLITTGDLDPLYVGLWKAPMNNHTQARFLIAYWCLYHAGVASYLADLTDDLFWDGLLEAANNQPHTMFNGEEQRWPRGAERRHWRGQAAVKSAFGLASLERTPLELVNWLAGGNGPEGAVAFTDVRKRAMEWPLFGPWIAFKIGDMLDRLNFATVTFNDAEVFMFDDPRKAALMLIKQHLGLPDGVKLKDEEGAIKQAVDYLVWEFRDLQAPPRADRPVGLQEVETVLCKWKSHMNGHYKPGKDTLEIAEGLKQWATVSPTAGLLLQAMPVWKN